MAARNCLDKSSSFFSPDDKGPVIAGKLNAQNLTKGSYYPPTLAICMYIWSSLWTRGKIYFINLPLPEVLQKSLKAFQWPQRTMLRGSKLLNNALHTESILQQLTFGGFVQVGGGIN